MDSCCPIIILVGSWFCLPWPVHIWSANGKSTSKNGQQYEGEWTDSDCISSTNEGSQLQFLVGMCLCLHITNKISWWCIHIYIYVCVCLKNIFPKDHDQLKIPYISMISKRSRSTDGNFTCVCFYAVYMPGPKLQYWVLDGQSQTQISATPMLTASTRLPIGMEKSIRNNHVSAPVHVHIQITYTQ